MTMCTKTLLGRLRAGLLAGLAAAALHGCCDVGGTCEEIEDGTSSSDAYDQFCDAVEFEIVYGAYSARLGHRFRQRSGHRFRTTWALGAKRRASPAWVWDPRVAIGVVGQVIRT